VWHELFPEGCCFELSTVFRQAEQRLVELLSDVRYAQLSNASVTLLRELARELAPPEGIEPTLLFGTNERVDAVNKRRLQQLEPPEHVFNATDSGKEPFISQMRKNCIAEDRLVLRTGAQVGGQGSQGAETHHELML
jgi:ATP-dependent DNA helicase PIF1